MTEASIGRRGADAGRAAVASPAAPAALGAYSQAIVHGGVLYCSGALPLVPESGELVGESLGAAATRCLTNLGAVCEAAGARLEDALRLTIYTTRLDRFAEIDAAYAAFFSDTPPARVAVGVAALPKGAPIEIDALVAVAAT